jgi:DivIVA domain-containing protein
VTNDEDQDFPYYRAPDAIRNETFARRIRGLDESEVYEYLDLLADQVEFSDKERRELRADNDRLRGELKDVRSQLSEYEDVGDRVNDQVVEMFSQAQLVAEEIVEDVSRDARQRLTQARAQERQILEEAMQTAERTRREAEAMIGRASQGSVVVTSSGPDASAAATELEQVRTFARAAQAQMQSIMEALASQAERLSGAPHRNGSPHPGIGGWQIESPPGDRPDPWGSA